MRRSWPHMPIMKYIGISVSSQKTKKRNRSSETKTPIMAVSITSREMKKPFTFSLDRFPGAENRERREERGEQDEEQADAVDAEMVMNGLADPVVEFLELVMRIGGIESRAAGTGKSRIRRPRRPARCGESRRDRRERRNSSATHAQQRQERDDRQAESAVLGISSGSPSRRPSSSTVKPTAPTTTQVA